jgi:hypothetical protein
MANPSEERVDMSHDTGGHYLDTGNGLAPIGHLIGNALEGAAQTAYRAYLDHWPTCAQCQQTTFLCDAATELWETYMAMRESA